MSANALDLYPWIAERFTDVRRRHGEYADAECPLKRHKTSRLRFWIGANDSLLFGCYAGCNKARILAAVGATWKDCFRDGVVPEHVVTRKVTARYQYTDEDYRVLFEVVRIEPGYGGQAKAIRPRHRGPSGKWVTGLPPEIRRVLYRLPQLQSTGINRAVCVVAGEKDADSLAAINVTATTNVFGESARWEDEYSRHLSGRHVIVIRDRDSAGTRHQDEVIGSLIRHGVLSVRPAVLPAKDTTEFLDSLRVKGVTSSAELQRELWQALQVNPAWTAVGVKHGRATVMAVGDTELSSAVG